jgi:hypothetical protein
MSDVATGGSAATVADDSPSLTDFIGGAMGDLYTVSETPERSSDASAGAPPAEASAPTPENDTAQEGEAADAEHAGAPPADAATPDPDPTAVSQPSVDDDPLKDARAFTYTVDGQERSVEGIKEIPGVGAIVDADFLPTLQQRLSERDHLFERSQEQHRKYTDLERVTAWPTKDAQGNPQTLTGAPAILEHRVVTARALATLDTLSQAIADPAMAAKLVTYEVIGQYEDGTPQYRLVWNPDGMEMLQLRARNKAIEAANGVRDRFASFSAPPPPPEPTIADIAMPTVDAQVKALNVSVSDEDKQFLASQLERYVRPTTPQEKQQGYGNRIVDASFTKLVERTAKQAQTVAKVAESAQSAATQNAAKLAAAASGKRTPAKAPVRPSNAPANRAPNPAQQRVQDTNSAWDIAERAGAAAMRSRTA